ncbi:low molecular weight protein arginine phosphatase [Fredinandcohnia quinoae]|uniref:Low molecular weight protein arginine phosphatase n=1 Tax=Fredinandcohnia quinoae TaxID=2918902 RepID=A0AAW5DWV1_9BACI|nr:low molecular weight protein arginine phosphatase [Fredinandcohnia sp. SECRCQ15]MCH1625127.1 low molecular weight protein arginine phosphatase [Fredinandcohnia sp. SECRCQ15]
MMTQILFVCTGNTCRSPMAEALLRFRAGNDLQVKSAGLFASDGHDVSTNTRLVLEENGIKCDHKSSFLTDDKVEWATYIFAMTNSHKQEILFRFPKAASKVFTLKEFVAKNGDVSDPYGGSLDIYRDTFDEMVPLIDSLLLKLTL